MQRQFREALASISVLQQAQLDIVLRALGDDPPEGSLPAGVVPHEEAKPPVPMPPSPATEYRSPLALAERPRRSTMKSEPVLTISRKTVKDFDVFRAPPFRLTAREAELLKYLFDGLSNKEMAKQLSVSPRTVEAHRSRIMEKFSAGNVVQLVSIVWDTFLRYERAGDLIAPDP